MVDLVLVEDLVPPLVVTAAGSNGHDVISSGFCTLPHRKLRGLPEISPGLMFWT